LHYSGPILHAEVKIAAALAAAALCGGLILAAVLLRPGASAPASTDQSALPVSQRAGFPAPPPGAVVYSRQMGADGLALGVVPKRGHVLAQVSVVGPQGSGVSGLGVHVNGARARECGAGCYRTNVSGKPTSVEVSVRSTTWRVALPAAWPPRDATVLLERAGRAWRSLHSLSFHERLASDSVHSTKSSWRVQAPDRVAYQVVGGWAGVVVGGRRWDRSPASRRWKPSVQSRLTQPVPGWVRVADAHVLGTTVVGGRPAWRISFFDPGTPGWFTVAIDRQNFYTLDSRMTATSHFMHDVYGSFNTTPPITPPK
jgi:hypothetical protein